MNSPMIISAESASALMSALVPIAICTAAGSAVGYGNSRWPGADMLVGLGLVAGALTMLAVATPIPLSWLMVALIVPSIIALAIGRQIPGGSMTWIALALVSPILFHAAANQAALFDEFWHWLPSAAYAFSYGSLVKVDLAPSLSQFPAFPQAMPLMIAAASLIARRFLEAAGPVINVALLAGMSALLADAMAATLARHGGSAAIDKPLLLVASAVAITIPLNPGLDGNLVLSSYADCGTMVAVAALGLIGVEMLAYAAGRGQGNAETLAWRFGLVGALLVNLKQANPMLLALVTAGLVVVAFRDPAIAKRRVLVLLPRMLGPAIVIFAVWRWYVIRNVPQGELAFRAFENWNFEALPTLLASIWERITEAPLFHAMMWLVTAAGVASFLRLPRKTGEARWLAVVCATVWLGYNAFLLVVYLGAFSDTDAETANSYDRYTTHVALLALYVPVVALASGPWPKLVKLGGVVPSLAAALMALCALPLRGDLNNPRDRPWPRFIRDTITDMRHAMPPREAKVVIVSCYKSLFELILRYDLWQFGVSEREIPLTVWTDDDDADPAALASLAVGARPII